MSGFRFQISGCRWLRSMYVRVKVKAGARKERFIEMVPGKFEIDVKEKAEMNAANERIQTLVARHFSVPVKAVRIISGHHRPNKTLDVIE